MVYIGHIGLVAAITVEGKQNGILTRTRVNSDRGDATTEEIVVINEHQRIGGSDTGTYLIVQHVADFGNSGVVIGVAETMHTHQEGLVQGVVLNNDKGTIAILRQGSITHIDVGVGSTVHTIDVAPKTSFVVGVKHFAEVGWEPTVRNVGVLGHVILDRDGQHAAHIRHVDAMLHLVLHHEIVVKHIPEGIRSVSGVEHHYRVTRFHL